MILPFSVPLTIAAYAVTWVVFHLACGYVAHRLPDQIFREDGIIDRLLASRRWESHGSVYRHIGITKWKDRLPEAGAFYKGGFNKRHISVATPSHLRRFRLETNRAEFSHWLTIASSLTFFAWNPWSVALFMVGYALVTNLPFILVQRFNRPRMMSLLAKRGS